MRTAFAQNIVGFSLAGVATVGVARRLEWVFTERGSLWVKGITIGLSVLAVLVLIDSVLRRERLWPPTRRHVAIIISTAAIALFVDTPGYLALLGKEARDHMIGAYERGTVDPAANVQDATLVAIGDDFAGALTRYPRILTDVGDALHADATACDAAIAKIDADASGFEPEALAITAVDDARARAKCAAENGREAEARAWIEVAARHELTARTIASAAYEAELYRTASAVAAGLHDPIALAFFTAKAQTARTQRSGPTS